MPALIGLYIFISTVLSFYDFDFTEETYLPGAAWHSMKWQTLYMSKEQMGVYFSDLGVIGAERLGVEGLDKDDIHDIANNLRQRSGKEVLDYPWQGPISFSYITYVRPLILLALDTNAIQYELGKEVIMEKIGL